MMPERQANRAMNVFVNAQVEFKPIPKAGHFAGVDKPKLVAEAIMSWLCRNPSMRARLNDAYIGFKGIWKGDERHVVAGFRKLYGIPHYHVLIEVQSSLRPVRTQNDNIVVRKKKVVVDINNEENIESTYDAETLLDVVTIPSIGRKKKTIPLSATSCRKDK